MDVAVVGGDIAGLTVAILLKRSGKTVAVIEPTQIITDVSGHISQSCIATSVDLHRIDPEN